MDLSAAIPVIAQWGMHIVSRLIVVPQAICLYRKIFPNATQNELEQSFDHRVQLLPYNKKVIKQLGVCYLHVKNSKEH